MFSRLLRARPARAGRPRRIARGGLVIAIVLSGFAPSAATANAPIPADGDLSLRNVDASGTGGLVKSVNTPSLRNGVPAASARILIVGTGVSRALFPAALQPQIAASGPSATDTYGFGTLAASTILQLIPDARITSIRVGAYDSNYVIARLGELADALTAARSDRYDAVLLAYPPQAALDPVTHVIAHGDYGRFGRGINLVTEALLSNPNGIAAIPEDKGLRARVFEGANLRQRDAVERFADQARQWNRTMAALKALDDAGIPVIAPAGDFTKKNGDQIAPIVTQTVYGLSAHPSVLTVGASYADGAVTRVSPTSARGPTLGLDLKPDVLAPADVMAMLPGAATLGWKDDSLRVPLQTLQWAKAGVPPSPCPAPDSAYRCVLQGSSMISASVVAANVAAMVAQGTPHPASARAAADDEILRGIAVAQASRAPATASDASRPAHAWEQGAGVLGGLKGIDLARTPVPLARADLGEVGWDEPASRAIALWPGGAPASASARTTGFVGPDQTGQTIARDFTDGRLSAVSDGTTVTLRAAQGKHQGGVYTGALTLTPPAGSPVTVPTSLTQGLPVDFKASYAYNELMTGGRDGERVEKATLVLFPGLPTNVGILGEAFKSIATRAFRAVPDPTTNYYLRWGITKDSFTDPSVSPAQHGRGTVPTVPPGFYRMHLLSDHGIDARQQRGREESLGIRLGSFGPDAAYVPGSNVLVGAQPPCSAGTAGGPFATGCVTRGDREVDPTNGFCVARNYSTQVAFNVYCGEIAYAIPSAVVSRAVHLIEHGSGSSEWDACGVDIPLDGTNFDFAALTAGAQSCRDTTAPSSWSFPQKAPDCLSPTEKKAFPQGHPSDINAVFSGPTSATVLRNFPVAVMTYRFKLPQPNTYTTAGVSLSYVADNAIVGVRFQTGSDPTGDASNSLLVADDPDVSVVPALERGPSKGSAYNEWAVMSANAAVGSLSIIVIPTAWANTSLDPTKPIARVQLCDVALRVNTFAKQSYGNPRPEGGVDTQFFPVLDRGLTQQIRPGTSRVRPIFEPGSGSFGAAGTEAESLTVAVQIPKNTTHASSPHRVLSPVGGPAYLKAGRRYADGARYESVLPAGFETYDPRYGVNTMTCKEGVNPDERDPERIRNAESCRLVNVARGSSGLLADLTPIATFNGRFAGTLTASHGILERAGGNVAFEVADADDGGAFESRWAKRDGDYVGRFTVSDFYDDAAPFSLIPISGVISVTKDAQGNATLRVNTNEIGGLSRTISALLG